MNCRNRPGMSAGEQGGEAMAGGGSGGATLASCRQNAPIAGAQVLFLAVFSALFAARCSSQPDQKLDAWWADVVWENMCEGGLGRATGPCAIEMCSVGDYELRLVEKIAGRFDYLVASPKGNLVYAYVEPNDDSGSSLYSFRVDWNVDEPEVSLSGKVEHFGGPEDPAVPNLQDIRAMRIAADGKHLYTLHGYGSFFVLMFSLLDNGGMLGPTKLFLDTQGGYCSSGRGDMRFCGAEDRVVFANEHCVIVASRDPESGSLEVWSVSDPAPCTGGYGASRTRLGCVAETNDVVISTWGSPAEFNSTDFCRLAFEGPLGKGTPSVVLTGTEWRAADFAVSPLCFVSPHDGLELYASGHEHLLRYSLGKVGQQALAFESLQAPFTDDDEAHGWLPGGLEWNPVFTHDCPTTFVRGGSLSAMGVTVTDAYPLVVLVERTPETGHLKTLGECQVSGFVSDLAWTADESFLFVAVRPDDQPPGVSDELTGPHELLVYSVSKQGKTER